MSWKKLIKDKSNGGVGIRDVGMANTALMGKVVWSLAQNSHKLWARVLSHKYLGTQHILAAPRVQGVSPLWRGILRARDSIKDGFRFKVGDGSTSVWFTDWSGSGALGAAVPYVHISDSARCLRDIIHGGFWNVSTLHTEIPPPYVNALQQMRTVVVPNMRDCWTWHPHASGIYSAAAGYDWLRNQEEEDPVEEDWGWVWKVEAPEKVRVFIWLLLQNGIQVNEKRYACHLSASPACPRCSNPVEDRFHCLRDCPHSMEVWRRLNALAWPNFYSQDIRSWVKGLARGRVATLFLAGLWGLWRWRNEKVLGEGKWTVDFVVQWIRGEDRDYQNLLGKGTGSLHGIDQVARWLLPPPGFYSLTVDGAFSTVHNRMALEESSGIVQQFGNLGFMQVQLVGILCLRKFGPW